MKLTRTHPSAEIPTAPMADVAFLLIVFFIVTLTFAARRGLDLGLPEPPALDERVELDEGVLVEVQADGGLIVDRSPMFLSRLLAHLEPTLRRDPRKPVIVRSSPGAAYGHVVEVLDELRLGRRRLGLDRDISIALPTEREIAEYWSF